MVALFVVVTIAALFLFDWAFVQRWAGRGAPAVAGPSPAGTPVPAEAGPPLTSLRPGQFGLPMGLFFHRGHAWLGLLRSGQVKVGLDDFLHRLLGRVDLVALPQVGKAVARGEPLATVRLGKRTLALRSPVDGTVVAINALWGTDPARAWGDPYGEGWMVKMIPTNLARTLRELKIAEPAVWWLQEEVRRFRDFATRCIAPDPELGPRLADGGLPTEGVLQHVDDPTWTRFQAEFLAG